MRVVDYLRAALAESDWSILQRLAELSTQAGMSLYIVGGPVRDCLLRRSVSDLDLTTEGEALALARRAASELGGTWKKFDRFGTAKLYLPGRATPIDVATTRTESYARPGALPEVTHGTIGTDLIRRDFTINAMAIRLDGDRAGELIDQYGGESDLRAGVLRVLHPHSFDDDPTRLFRGVRFEQRFGFTFGAETVGLIAPSLPVIDQISGDRIRHELELIFDETQPLRALLRLQELAILQQIDPELQIDEWIASRFGAQAAPFDRFTCWAWLSCRLSAVSLTRFSQRVNLARAEITDLEQLRTLKGAAETISQWNSRSELYHTLSAYHDRALRAGLTVIDQPAAQSAIVLYLNELRAVRPTLDGTRLQALGVASGPLMGLILREVHAALLNGVITTPQQEEAYAQQIVAREGR